MLTYTLCFIKQESRLLLLNREFGPWMGCWNGIGGKIEKGEHPRASALREIKEEASIEHVGVAFKGILTWSTKEGAEFGGLYLYDAELPADVPYITPVLTDEGILDWKEIGWIMHEANMGVAANLPYLLTHMLHPKSCSHIHGFFDGNRLVSQHSSAVDPAIEQDERLRNEYLHRYAESL